MWNFLKRFKGVEEEPELHDHPWEAAGSFPAGKSIIGALENMPPGIITTAKPTTGGIGFARRRRDAAPTPVAMSIKSPEGIDSIVIEANSTTIMESWDTKEAMVDRPIGALGFAAGIAYIMTRGGWVNMGEALEKPLEMTDRRGAIKAQKAKKKEQL